MTDQLLSPEEVHTRRSKLINDHKTEVRALEKELKKKKLPGKQRDALEERLTKIEEEHEIALREFDAKQGLTKEKEDKEDTKKDVHEAEAQVMEVDLEDIEERTWSSLSKKDLEEECVKRGLSKKGSKEDLVSRLNLYTLSLKSKAKAAAEAGDKMTGDKMADKAPLSPAEKAAAKQKKKEMDFAAMAIPMNVSSGPGGAKKDQYREKRKKLWKRRGGPPAEKKTDKSSDEEGSGDEEGEEEEVKDEEKERQQKREKLVGQVITAIFKKSDKPIKLQDIPQALEKKVKNVTPQIMGYETWEEWVAKQSRDLLYYDKETKSILPPRELPSEEESEEEDSDEESDSEEDEE